MSTMYQDVKRALAGATDREKAYAVLLAKLMNCDMEPRFNDLGQDVYFGWPDELSEKSLGPCDPMVRLAVSVQAHITV